MACRYRSDTRKPVLFQCRFACVHPILASRLYILCWIAGIRLVRLSDAKPILDIQNQSDTISVLDSTGKMFGITCQHLPSLLRYRTGTGMFAGITVTVNVSDIIIRTCIITIIIIAFIDICIILWYTKVYMYKSFWNYWSPIPQWLLRV